MQEQEVSLEELKQPVQYNQSKASGDTLYFEDFANGFTNRWTPFDAGLNGFNWIYTTQAPGGQYASTVPAIASTSSANGFASLPSSFYNTPTPAAGWVNMDALLTSGPIAIPPTSNVLIKWQQSQRFCCASATARLELSVSTDNVNWVAFDARFGRGANTAVFEFAEINISSVAANQDTIYLRWYQGETRNYYWMIDDIAIVEGPGHQLEITEVFTSFGSDQYEGYYAQVPNGQTQPLSFGATIRNTGGFDATNVDLEVTVSKTGVGEVFNDSSAILALLPPLQDDTFNVVTPYGNNDGPGAYTATLFARADSASGIPSKATYSIPWIISDSVFAKDFDNAGGSIGPGSYVGGDNDGSRIGTKYTLTQAWQVNSLSYYITNTADNVGVEIKAKIWGFDTTQASLDQMVTVPGLKAQNPIPYIIQQSDLGTWITLSMIPYVTLPAGQYVAAIEQSGGNISNQELRIGRATDIEELQPYGNNFSSFVYANDAAPAWGNIFAQPMIRMNIDIPTSLKENTKAFESSIVPNPSSGQFSIRMNDQVNISSIQVFSLDGKQVHFMSIGQTTQQIDMNLAGLDKGVYFVQINSNDKRVIEKIVIQ
tara:strand:+ start:355 stop:2148 length:1794 start_codon:yes stop_codon:yes gene_type:complete